MSNLLARLTDGKPKRILALDGGGTRGMITLGFLREIETTLRLRTANLSLVLADYFDLIGGTSVGSLIAAMLAKGDDVATVTQTFQEGAPQIFKDRLSGRIPIVGKLPVVARYNASPLRDFIDRQVGSKTTLADPQFKTGLAVIAKRLDTGSVWLFTNSPTHPYFARRTNDNRGRKGNGEYLISDVLRASTAAPTFFSPKKIVTFDSSDKPSLEDGVFVDGGASPHNNPSLMLFKMAAMRGFNMGGGPNEPYEARKPWALGEDKLLIVSVGTGGYTHTARQSWTAGGDGYEALLGVMSDSQELVLTMMQWLSNNDPERSWHLNSVMRKLSGDVLGLAVGAAEAKPGTTMNGTQASGPKPLLSFQRYDAPLNADWLQAELGRTISSARLNQLRDFTNPLDLKALAEIGRAAAEKQVKPEHFPAAFDDIWREGTPPT